MLPNRSLSALVSISLVLIATGAIAHLYYPIKAGYILALGGLLLSVCYLSGIGKQTTVRLRRLNRIGFFGALAYLVGGGCMLQGLNWWIVAFCIGTLLVVYSLWISMNSAE